MSGVIIAPMNHDTRAELEERVRIGKAAEKALAAAAPHIVDANKMVAPPARIFGANDAIMYLIKEMATDNITCRTYKRYYNGHPFKVTIQVERG